MNKAITDGLLLMPPTFADGLDVWSSGDGSPGTDTYAGSSNGVFVAADQDFGGCLEILKSSSTTRVRYMGETPVLPGCYLRITARVKAVSGNLPSVRIATRPSRADGGSNASVTNFGPSVTLTNYGEVVEVSQIVGTGDRNGVDMFWFGDVAYAHVGIDFTGSNGGVVRVDDIEVEDVTSVFLRDMMASVDVRDYGAVGDGSTDDSAAFSAADAAADGRTVIVPEGVYHLDDDVTIDNPIRFVGTVTMPTDKRLALIKNYNLRAYYDAFGDEEIAFKHAFHALLYYTNHESLDLDGMRVSLTEPVDMQAAVPSRTTYATRRVIRNGQIHPIDGSAWDADVVVSQASYDPEDNKKLTNVAGIANIAVGSLVEGNGVGREVYVTDSNVATQTLTISQSLFDAEGSQAFTFTRFKYMLDFSGFDQLTSFQLKQVEFQCEGEANALMLAKSGSGFSVTDCIINRPKERGITSFSGGCQGMMVDRCQFISNESALKVEDRTTIGMNTNANDVKIRDNRIVLFKHFVVIAGAGSTIVGNHWFHGDDETDGVRKGGLIFTSPNVKSLITGNYVDNNFIEWTNEHSSSPDWANQFSFGGLTITGNVFTCNNTADWFNWLVIKPFGTGHYIQGLNVTGNVFRSLNGSIDRVEHIDTSYADLDYGKMVNIVFQGNTFNGVTEPVYNPATLRMSQNTASKDWILDTEHRLPFSGYVRTVEAVTLLDPIENASGGKVYESPHVTLNYGTDNTQAKIEWSEPTTGTISVVARMDFTS